MFCKTVFDLCRTYLWFCSYFFKICISILNMPYRSFLTHGEVIRFCEHNFPAIFLVWSIHYLNYLVSIITKRVLTISTAISRYFELEIIKKLIGQRQKAIELAILTVLVFYHKLKQHELKCSLKITTYLHFILHTSWIFFFYFFCCIRK